MRYVLIGSNTNNSVTFEQQFSSYSLAKLHMLEASMNMPDLKFYIDFFDDEFSSQDVNSDVHTNYLN